MAYTDQLEGALEEHVVSLGVFSVLHSSVGHFCSHCPFGIGPDDPWSRFGLSLR